MLTSTIEVVVVSNGGVGCSAIVRPAEVLWWFVGTTVKMMVIINSVPHTVGASIIFMDPVYWSSILSKSAMQKNLYEKVKTKESSTV